MVTYDNAVHKDTAKYYGIAENPGSVSGLGGLSYESPWQLDKKYYGTANSASVQYQKAAGQILQGAEGAEAAMLKAYRDLYRSRLGASAAGQRMLQDGYASEAAGQGLSGDVVRRLLAQSQAQNAQGLAGLSGELDADYGMNRASLLQTTGNSLANLLIDETKFGKSYAAGRRSASNAMTASVIGAGAGIAGAGLGGLAFGSALGGAGGGVPGGPFTGGGPTAPSGYNVNQYGQFS